MEFGLILIPMLNIVDVERFQQHENSMTLINSVMLSYFITHICTNLGWEMRFTNV